MQRLSALLLLFPLIPLVRCNIVGGVSDFVTPTSQDDPDVQKIRAESVQTAFARTLGSIPPEFHVIHYKKQVVAGMNYFAKIRYDENKYAYIQVFAPLPHTNKEPELVSVDINVSETPDPSSMPGGTSDVKIPTSQNDPDIKAIRAQSVQTDFAKAVGSVPPQFHVVHYKTQVVAGINYFAKIKYDDDKFAHIRVYEPLPFTNKEPELVGVQFSKSEQEEVMYFHSNIDKTDGNFIIIDENSNSASALDWSFFALFSIQIFAFLAC